MNQLAILAPGQQTVTVGGLMMGYQVFIADPSGNSVTINSNGSTFLPPLTLGQVYTILVQSIGVPPVTQITGAMGPKGVAYACVAGGPPVVTITIN